MSREKTDVIIQVCDFGPKMGALAAEFIENNPKEELGLIAVRFIPNMWGYVDSPVGMFIVNEDAELIWFYMVDFVPVSVYPKYKSEGIIRRILVWLRLLKNDFESAPKWKLDLNRDVFVGNHAGTQNLEKFIRSGAEYDERYINIKAVLEAAAGGTKDDIMLLFQRFKEGSFWSQ